MRFFPRGVCVKNVYLLPRLLVMVIVMKEKEERLEVQACR